MSYFMTSHEITQNTDILITAGSFHKYHVELPKYRSGNSPPPKKKKKFQISQTFF